MDGNHGPLQELALATFTDYRVSLERPCSISSAPDSIQYYAVKSE